MANRKSWLKFQTIGAVALDAYYASAAEAAPQEEAQKRKKGRPAPEPVRTRPYLTAACGVVCAFLLILTMFGGSRIHRADQRIEEMQQTVAGLEEARQQAQADYDEAVDLEEIAKKARQMGMQYPRERPMETPAEILTIPEEEMEHEISPFEAVWFALRDTTRELLAYLGIG